jgi:hypothetical protein
MTAELPPAVALMLNEFQGKRLEPETVRRTLNDEAFLDDFNDQSLAGIRTFTYADRLAPRLDKFDIYAGGGLNPLSPYGKCQQPACRVAYAHQFARTACLYADRVVIPDPFSFGPPDTEDDVYLTVVILHVLKPLIDEGIVVFGPSAYGTCSLCMKAIGKVRRQLTTQLWREFQKLSPDVFRFKHEHHWKLSFGSPLFQGDDEPYRMTFRATKADIAATKSDVVLKGARAKELIRSHAKGLKNYFAHCAHSASFSARVGSFCHTTVATNTREDATAYRLLEGRSAHTAEASWARLRSVPLPALRRLSASQALAVRYEAEKALPAFRAKVQHDLMSLKKLSDEQEEQRAIEVAGELREAARDLQGQLASVNLRSIKGSEKLFASLAVALEVVALSTMNPASVLAVSGTLGALLLAAHKSQSTRAEKHELLVHQPAYVLLSAERVHADGHEQ